MDQRTSAEAAEGVAARMLAWLQAEGIIGPPETVGDIHRRWIASIGGADDPALTGDSRIVYRPGPAYRRACLDDRPSSLVFNWLEVKIGRRIFDAGELGLGIHCPSCGAEQTEGSGDWSEAFSAWHRDGTGDTLACHACGLAAPLTGYRFEPAWGFGCLGFAFANWWLDPLFVAAFARRLGHDVVLVHTRI